MSDRVQQALDNHKKKYNCCQAVACAFCKDVGVDETIMFKAGEGFGLGMGGMECTCGAISGAVMVAGFKNSSGALDNPVTKAETYRLSSAIIDKFQEKNGTTICKVLKGIETGSVLRSCDGCIEDAAKIAEEVLALQAN
ncbi:MAG: C-GCAxxG-C-C family protein [Lachnospiraceae bacterium]